MVFSKLEIHTLLRELNLTAYKLAKSIDMSEAVISNIKLGKSKPSYSFLEKLLAKYEGVNLNYLVTGRGDKHFDQENGGVARTTKSRVGRDAYYGDLRQTYLEIIRLQKENLDFKDEKISELQKKLRSFQK